MENYCNECGKKTFCAEYNKNKDGFCGECGKLNNLMEE